MASIAARIKNTQAAVSRYAQLEYPAIAGKAALRFIDDNFRNASWEGVPWKRRKILDRGRALLVKRAVLRRSFRYQAMNAAARIFTDVKYARAHNEGFRGTVNVEGHSRRTFGKFRASSVSTQRSRVIRTESGQLSVKGHTRNMNIPRRQFMPTALRQSPTLNNSIKRQVTVGLMKILKRT
jgi:phage gpG-like protein